MPAPQRRPRRNDTRSASPPRRRARRAPRAPSPQHVEGADRLQKVLAAAGIASRRDCEQLILDGRVEVDRVVVTELGTRVDPRQQEIRIDGEALHSAKLVYYAVNKPDGVVCTASDPAGRPRVIDLLPTDGPRAFCVGRLDMSSEGLLLVTNDGELANGLTHPRHGVEKIYHVQVAGALDDDGLARLRKGMHLAEGFARVKHARIKSRKAKSTIVEMILDEGRNREIRRLLAKVGHKVQRLVRVAVGPVRLGELPAGAVRPLTKQEISALKQAVAAGPRPKSAEGASTARSAKTAGKQTSRHRGGKKLGTSKSGPQRRSIIGD